MLDLFSSTGRLLDICLSLDLFLSIYDREDLFRSSGDSLDERLSSGDSLLFLFSYDRLDFLLLSVKCFSYLELDFSILTGFSDSCRANSFSLYAFSRNCSCALL